MSQLTEAENEAWKADGLCEHGAYPAICVTCFNAHITTLESDLADALRLGGVMAEAIAWGEDIDALDAESKWRDRFGNVKNEQTIN